MPTKTVETYARNAQGQNVLVSTVTVNVPQEEVNADALETKATAALTTNATFLAIASPTTAQTTAQVKALTRQMNGIIRLQRRLLSDISDT